MACADTLSNPLHVDKALLLLLATQHNALVAKPSAKYTPSLHGAMPKTSSFRISLRRHNFDTSGRVRTFGLRQLQMPETCEYKDVRVFSDDNNFCQVFNRCDYDNHDIRIPLGVTPRYIPLSEQLLKNPDSLIEMAKQMIVCIDDLRYKANILHRDISEGNIMYTQNEGKGRFILIDYDLGIKVTKEGFPLGPSARHRTGTLPFMAYELVETIKSPDDTGDPKPIQHCVRHDFESLFWVSLRCAVRLTRPESHGEDESVAKARDDFLAGLEKGKLNAVAGRKENILNTQSEMMKCPLSASFTHLRTWLNSFRIPFWNYKAAREHAEINLWRQTQTTTLTGSRQPAGSKEAILDDFASYETGYGTITRSVLLKAIGAEEEL